VEQDDAAGMGVAGDLIADVTGVAVLPVPGVDGPEDDLLVEGGGGGGDGTVVGAVWGTEEFDALAGDGLDGVGSDSKIIQDSRVGQTGEVFVIPGVTADVVAGAGHASNGVGVAADELAEREEGGAGVMIIEDVK